MGNSTHCIEGYIKHGPTRQSAYPSPAETISVSAVWARITRYTLSGLSSAQSACRITRGGSGIRTATVLQLWSAATSNRRHQMHSLHNLSSKKTTHGSQ